MSRGLILSCDATRFNGARRKLAGRSYKLRQIQLARDPGAHYSRILSFCVNDQPKSSCF